VIFQRAREGTRTTWDGGVMRGANVQVGVVFEEEGPGRGVKFGRVFGGRDHGG